MSDVVVTHDDPGAHGGDALEHLPAKIVEQAETIGEHTARLEALQAAHDALTAAHDDTKAGLDGVRSRVDDVASLATNTAVDPLAIADTVTERVLQTIDERGGTHDEPAHVDPPETVHNEAPKSGGFMGMLRKLNFH